MTFGKLAIQSHKNYNRVIERCLIEPPYNCACFRSNFCVLGKEAYVYHLHILHEKYTLHVVKGKHAQ